MADGSEVLQKPEQTSGSAVVGVICACALGVCNGSLMMSMTCFQKGCPAIGIEPYTGDVLAPLAVLPSLSVGILVAQPVLFLLYWGRSIAKGVMPEFHLSEVAVY